MKQPYKQMYCPSHPRCSSSGTVVEHVLVAERAIGKHLPAGAEVHHVDRNRMNNAGRNLVICQGHSYHLLLHSRQWVVDAGGNPDTQRRCSTCKRLLPFSMFNRRKAHRFLGLQTSCRECQKTYQRGYKRRRKSDSEAA